MYNIYWHTFQHYTSSGSSERSLEYVNCIVAILSLWLIIHSQNDSSYTWCNHIFTSLNFYILTIFDSTHTSHSFQVPYHHSSNHPYLEVAMLYMTSHPQTSWVLHVTVMQEESEVEGEESLCRWPGEVEEMEGDNKTLLLTDLQPAPLSLTTSMVGNIVCYGACARHPFASVPWIAFLDYCLSVVFWLTEL